MTEIQARLAVRSIIEEGFMDNLKKHRGKIIGAGIGGTFGGLAAVGNKKRHIAAGVGIGAGIGAGIGNVFGRMARAVNSAILAMHEAEQERQEKMVAYFPHAMTSFDDIKDSLKYLPESIYSVNGSKYIDKIHLILMAVYQRFKKTPRNDVRAIMEFYSYADDQLEEINRLMEMAQNELVPKEDLSAHNIGSSGRF